VTETDRPDGHCARCGRPIYKGDAFCGACGAAVLNPPHQAEQVIRREAAARGATAGGRRPLLVAGVLGALFVLLAGGALAATLTGALGPGREGADVAQDGSQTGGGTGVPSSPPGAATPEDTAPPEGPSQSDPDAPHPAFDPLLPTLSGMTSAPIVLPADLPAGFQDVAIDEATEGDDYAILFLGEGAESGDVVQPFVNAWVDGTLEAAPVVEGEPELPDQGSDFEFSSGQAMTFEGAVGAYNCYEPSPGYGGTGGPFCEGAYTKGDYRYRLTLEGSTPPEEEMAQMLSSMAPVEGMPLETTTSASPEPTSASPGPDTGDVEAEAEEAAGDYYRAAGLEDWAYTYENLDSETQAMFTEEEWIQKNQWFADNGEVVYHIESAERLGTSSGLVVGVSLRLTYEDGTSSTRDTYFVYEGGEWKHAFGQEERDLFMPELSYEEFVEAQ
jgi:hypothetical protein